MKELYKAIADLQQEVPHIYKGTTGYGYKYAQWSEILQVINPLFKKHKLGFVQPLDGTSVKTIVFHVESGESIEASFEIPQGVQLKGMNDFQVLGSGITYIRRYALSSLLGLVTDEDKDASGEQVSKLKTREDGHDAEILERAKSVINTTLEDQSYETPAQKRAFIKKVLGKETITNEQEANEIMDALENEA